MYVGPVIESSIKMGEEGNSPSLASTYIFFIGQWLHACRNILKHGRC